MKTENTSAQPNNNSCVSTFLFFVCRIFCATNFTVTKLLLKAILEIRLFLILIVTKHYKVCLKQNRF